MFHHIPSIGKTARNSHYFLSAQAQVFWWSAFLREKTLL